METQELKARLIKIIETANEAELQLLENYLYFVKKETGRHSEASPTLTLEKSSAQTEEDIPEKQLMKEPSEKYGLKDKIDYANPPQEIKDLLEIAIKQGENGQTRSNDEIKKLIINKYGFQL